VALSAETVTALQHCGRRCTAQLGVLDRTARDADEVVVMTRVAADVRAFARAGELPDRTGRSEQFDRPVDRREPERRFAPTRAVVHLDDRERAALALDGIKDCSALRSEADVRGKLELGHGRSIVRTILIRKCAGYLATVGGL
jgi:hypothetical protein